jgi:hypothetical protein
VPIDSNKLGCDLVGTGLALSVSANGDAHRSRNAHPIGRSPDSRGWKEYLRSERKGTQEYGRPENVPKRTRFDCDDSLRWLTGSAYGFADRASPVPTNLLE